MNVRLIAVQAVVLAGLAVLYFAVVRPDSGGGDLPATGKEVLVGDFPVDRVRGIVVKKWNEEEKREDVVELRKTEDEGEDAPGSWIVASSYGYPALPAKIDELIDMVREIKSGPVRGENPDLWANFELDEKTRTAVTFLDGTGGKVLELVLGKVNINFASLFRTQMGEKPKDDSTTYVRLG
ncbi:MAG: hypothetical protein ACYS47_18330, partial [Planctomycetota bacterium]